jgi:hypothetical protein
VGAFEGQIHIFFLGRGQDRILKNVLLFAHAVVTKLSPPPTKKGEGRYSVISGEYLRYIAPL